MEKPNRSILSVECLFEDGNMSVSRVALSGINKLVVNHKSTTVYTVLEGEGVMYIDGAEHQLYAGQTVVVPKDVPYFDQGEVEMIAVSVPPFDTDSVEYLE